MSNDQHKKPLKLKDIKKDTIYKVPDGYFDKLPHVVQSKAVESEKVGVKRLKIPPLLKYAIPTLMLVIAIFYFNSQPNADGSPEALLAQVDDSDLVYYLQDTDITSEEIMENLDFSKANNTLLDKEEDIFNELEGIEDEEALKDLYNEYNLPG